VGKYSKPSPFAWIMLLKNPENAKLQCTNLRPYRRNGVRGKSHTLHTLMCKLIKVKTSLLLLTGMISMFTAESCEEV
jgi:hypothetical protein